MKVTGLLSAIAVAMSLFCSAVLAQSVPANSTNYIDVQKGHKSVWNGGKTDVFQSDGVVTIMAEEPTDAGWTSDVEVNPFAVYRLSGKIKTENVKNTTGVGALLNVHGMSIKTKALTGTNDWTDVSVEFQTSGEDYMSINCLFGGWGQSTGKAWYKDVRLTLVKTLPAELCVPEGFNPTVRINAQKTGCDISPYIYGQFIEHLGRCIYGGIWAEMLLDRKFHDIVGKGESPWYPVYECALKMDRSEPFVGGWTPVVQTEADEDARWIGVAQKGLAFQKDRKYVGYAWVKPSEGIEKIEVHFHYSDDHESFQAFKFPVRPNEYTKVEFSITSPVDYPDAEIEVAAFGTGTLAVGCVSLMPADNINGMRADTLAALKELNSPVYRWPGGNFVSGYDWKDGIGDRDRRPPRKNPAWQGIEHNDFGMDEFMVFCRYLGTEPYIAVNTGAGQVANAVKELEYANGSADTPMGKWRAENGNVQPYNVKFWGIGNEMFGSWQIGNMPVTDYVVKHSQFYDAFKAFDPDLYCIGVGAVGSWNETFIPRTFDKNDGLSEHIYDQRRSKVVDHVRLVANSIDRVAAAHASYRQKWPQLYQKKDLQVIMDEWNYWYGPHVFGELGTRYFQKDGMGIAAGLHAFYRHSDLYFMANYAQTVNVIGAIKTSKTAAKLESTGLVLSLYRNHFGTKPVETAIESKLSYKSGALDVSAALTSDGKAMTIAFVNCATIAVKTKLAVEGVELGTTGTRFDITDRESDPMSYNDPDEPSRITLKESRLELTEENELELPPMSVTLVKLPVK